MISLALITSIIIIHHGLSTYDSYYQRFQLVTCNWNVWTAIFFPCQPYIESTTVLSDNYRLQQETVIAMVTMWLLWQRTSYLPHILMLYSVFYPHEDLLVCSTEDIWIYICITLLLITDYITRDLLSTWNWNIIIPRERTWIRRRNRLTMFYCLFIFFINLYTVGQ